MDTLRHALDPEGAGRNLFFSYGADLTLHSQRQADVMADPVSAAKPLHARADKRFFWNKALAKPLIEAGADRWGDGLRSRPAVAGVCTRVSAGSALHRALAEGLLEPGAGWVAADADALTQGCPRVGSTHPVLLS